LLAAVLERLGWWCRLRLLSDRPGELHEPISCRAHCLKPDRARKFPATWRQSHARPHGKLDVGISLAAGPIWVWLCMKNERWSPYLFLLRVSSGSPFSFLFRGWGLSTKEQSMPLAWQEMQLSSSSSLMTHLMPRLWHARQATAERPLSGESDPGESSPHSAPRWLSRTMLAWRLGGCEGRKGLGAI